MKSVLYLKTVVPLLFYHEAVNALYRYLVKEELRFHEAPNLLNQRIQRLWRRRFTSSNFVRLHNQNSQHPDIIACTDDSDREAIALGFKMRSLQ